MKKLILATLISPGAALAHGGHAPLPEAAHGLGHAGPVVGLVLIATVLVLAVYDRWRA